MEMKILKNEPEEIEFELIGVDQSLPQMIVEKLNQDKNVTFAAFKVAHPLVANPSVLVKTKRAKAADVVVKCLEETLKEVQAFSKKFADISG